jgi:hypothetical protein
MKTVKLIVTGDLEAAALHHALRRIFCDIELSIAVKLDGFTSAELTEVPLLGGPTASDVEKLALKLVTEVEPGRRDRPPDMAILVDDLELCNQARPERAVAHVRRAVEHHLERLPWPSRASRDRACARIRERCSFHLLDPMIETYFFGEPAALVRAGAKRPSSVEPRVTDLERFVTSDAAFLARPDSLPGEELPPWARPQRARHPKHYLQFLCDPSGAVRRAYQEVRDGSKALGSLAWEEVLKHQQHVRFLRSLILDIADRFDEREIALRFTGDAHPLTWPGEGTVLRNI